MRHKAIGWAALAAAAVAVAGCGGGPASVAPSSSSSTAVVVAPAVDSWHRANAETFRRMDEAIADLSKALRDKDFPGVRGGCTEVSMATHAMSTALPTPDAGLTAAVQQVMNNLAAVEQQCPPLSNNADVVGQLDAARSQFDIAKRILGEAH